MRVPATSAVLQQPTVREAEYVHAGHHKMSVYIDQCQSVSASALHQRFVGAATTSVQMNARAERLPRLRRRARINSRSLTGARKEPY